MVLPVVVLIPGWFDCSWTLERTRHRPFKTTDRQGKMIPEETPLDLTNRCLREQKIGGREAGEEELLRLEAIPRLLMSVEAIHAVSWLSPTDWPSIADGASIIDGGAGDARQTKKTSTAGTPLSLALPILGCRAGERGVLHAPVQVFSEALGRTGGGVRS